jgi:hypothetical protein
MEIGDRPHSRFEAVVREVRALAESFADTRRSALAKEVHALRTSREKPLA